MLNKSSEAAEELRIADGYFTYARNVDELLRNHRLQRRPKYLAACQDTYAGERVQYHVEMASLKGDKSIAIPGGGPSSRKAVRTPLPTAY